MVSLSGSFALICKLTAAPSAEVWLPGVATVGALLTSVTVQVNAGVVVVVCPSLADTVT